MQRYRAPPPKSGMNILLLILMYSCFAISLYLIYDWMVTERMYKCQQVATTYGFSTYENYSGVLLNDLHENERPADTREVQEFKARLTDVKWDKIEPELKQFEKTMGSLLEQLEGVSSRFIGPIGLRNSLEKQIRQYDLCRNKIKGQNRDLSHRYETLRNQQKLNRENLKDLDSDETLASKRKDELKENLRVKRSAYSQKEKEFKQVEDELESFQERTKQQMEKLYYQLENRAKKELQSLQNEMAILDQSLFKTKSNRDLQSEQSYRLTSKIQGMLMARDLLKKKLEKFELKIDYDTELKKLLPSDQTIQKSMQLQKVVGQRFAINAAILKNMKGLSGEQQQRREVQRLKSEYKNIKQLLSRVNQTIFSFQWNFQRQIENTKSELASLNDDIDKNIRARNLANAQVDRLSGQLSQLQIKRSKFSLDISSKQQTGIPKDVEAERQIEAKRSDLTIQYNVLKSELSGLENDLKDLETLSYDIDTDDNSVVNTYSTKKVEINRKIKETDSELNKFKRIMLSKLAECNNKKKFIESIQNKGMEQLEEAGKYLKNIHGIKQMAKEHLDQLYIQ